MKTGPAGGCKVPELNTAAYWTQRDQPEFCEQQLFVTVLMANEVHTAPIQALLFS